MEEAARLGIPWPLQSPRSVGRPSRKVRFRQAVVTALWSDPEAAVSLTDLTPPGWWEQGMPITRTEESLLEPTEAFALEVGQRAQERRREALDPEGDVKAESPLL